MPSARSDQFDCNDCNYHWYRNAQTNYDQTTASGNHATNLAFSSAPGERDADGSGDPGFRS